MGRDCLWQVQAADYQVVYVAHYIGLAWCAVSWVYDAVQLPGWLRKSNAKQPLNVCYSTWPLISPAYLVLLGIAVMWVTLTWAAFVDWNTNNNGLTRLALFLILAIALWGLAACGLLHVWRAKSSLERQGPARASNPSVGAEA